MTNDRKAAIKPCARMERELQVNVFHLPLVIYKVINLHTDNYRLIWLYLFEIQTVMHINRKLMCCVSGGPPSPETTFI